MSTSVRGALPELPRDWPLWAGLLAVELVALGTYLATTTSVSQPRYLVYPFLWINLGLFVLVRANAPEGDDSFAGALGKFLTVGSDLSTRDRRRVTAALVALGYGLVLAVVTGLIGVPLVPHTHAHPTGLQLSLSAPGWGPRIAYVVGDYHLYFVPYRVVGYVALSYLLYVRLASLSLLSGAGLLGVASCVGCAFPLVAGAFGGAAAAALGTVSGVSLDVSTLAFLVAVTLLWQPWRKQEE